MLGRAMTHDDGQFHELVREVATLAERCASHAREMERRLTFLERVVYGFAASIILAFLAALLRLVAWAH